VVASSIEGYANVARAGRDALMVAPNDVDALAGALRRALYEPEERARLVASGAERTDEFAMRRLAGLYLDRYTSLVDGAKPIH
jgi:glycosyltransferase involved in cell wall biosynthesis